MCKFRDLRADEIECRVQQVKEKGLVLLLYKDARVDMNILDETVGSAYWQREHYECKGNLFCRVGIDVNGYKQAPGASSWVWKSDCGTESNTEAQKGEASDSFKRACFNWGIGRELYTAPFRRYRYPARTSCFGRFGGCAQDGRFGNRMQTKSFVYLRRTAFYLFVAVRKSKYSRRCCKRLRNDG